jgi:hypothetical protein
VTLSPVAWAAKVPSISLHPSRRAIRRPRRARGGRGPHTASGRGRCSGGESRRPRCASVPPVPGQAPCSSTNMAVSSVRQILCQPTRARPRSAAPPYGVGPRHLRQERSGPTDEGARLSGGLSGHTGALAALFVPCGCVKRSAAERDEDAWTPSPYGACGVRSPDASACLRPHRAEAPALSTPCRDAASCIHPSFILREIMTRHPRVSPMSCCVIAQSEERHHSE